MIKTLHKRLLVQPSISQMRGSIFIPENMAAATTVCRVLSAGHTVNKLLQPGTIVLVENGIADRNGLAFKDSFFVKEENVFAIIRNGEILPIGKTVLILRDLREEVSVGGIITPENRKAQSLFGSILRMGITREIFRTQGIKIGDNIRLTRWEPHMVEVEIPGMGFGLIVKETDLLYKLP